MMKMMMSMRKMRWRAKLEIHDEEPETEIIPW